ncbi:Hypothetical predicted protein [Podarcis lilfordi]|uniref:Uncharacterized protein n=1 Tax=Podarcis lilfordi TaxID=74358 RepID=A0AA35LAU3_9SAUR|nr:Hypothetical predicted protein [Podarcis lilfordi]
MVKSSQRQQWGCDTHLAFQTVGAGVCSQTAFWPAGLNCFWHNGTLMETRAHGNAVYLPAAAVPIYPLALACFRTARLAGTGTEQWEFTLLQGFKLLTFQLASLHVCACVCVCVCVHTHTHPTSHAKLRPSFNYSHTSGYRRFSLHFFGLRTAEFQKYRNGLLLGFGSCTFVEVLNCALCMRRNAESQPMCAQMCHCRLRTLWVANVHPIWFTFATQASAVHSSWIAELRPSPRWRHSHVQNSLVKPGRPKCLHQGGQLFIPSGLHGHSGRGGDN